MATLLKDKLNGAATMLSALAEQTTDQTVDDPGPFVVTAFQPLVRELAEVLVILSRCKLTSGG